MRFYPTAKKGRNMTALEQRRVLIFPEERLFRGAGRDRFQDSVLIFRRCRIQKIFLRCFLAEGFPEGRKEEFIKEVRI